MIARPATFVANGKTYKLHIGPNRYWNQEKLELKIGALHSEFEKFDKKEVLSRRV